MEAEVHLLIKSYICIQFCDCFKNGYTSSFSTSPFFWMLQSPVPFGWKFHLGPWSWAGCLSVRYIFLCHLSVSIHKNNRSLATSLSTAQLSAWLRSHSTWFYRSARNCCHPLLVIKQLLSHSHKWGRKNLSVRYWYLRSDFISTSINCLKL